MANKSGKDAVSLAIRNKRPKKKKRVSILWLSAQEDLKFLLQFGSLLPPGSCDEGLALNCVPGEVSSQLWPMGGQLSTVVHGVGEALGSRNLGGRSYIIEIISLKGRREPWLIFSCLCFQSPPFAQPPQIQTVSYCPTKSHKTID